MFCCFMFDSTCYRVYRVVQIILEQNQNKPDSLSAKIIRVYSSYWFSIARCPPLKLRLIDMTARKRTRKIALPFQSKEKNEVILEEITEEEMYEGYAIASAMNFKMLGLSVSISQSGGERFGPAKDLSPLGDMVGILNNMFRPLSVSLNSCLVFPSILGWVIGCLCLRC